jgi:hypothetical protein
MAQHSAARRVDLKFVMSYVPGLSVARGLEMPHPVHFRYEEQG